MSDSEDRGLERLETAIRACMEHRTAPVESDADFLDRHDSIRDLLEPMLQGEPAGGDSVGTPQPRFIGGFEIVREIGRGGMGVVYEASQRALARRVALKILPAHLTLSAVQVERFRREAAAAARLQHPAIIPIHEVGEDDGTHFIAMQLVGGGTLEDRIPDGPEPRDAAELLASVADALHHAHENGVIHRDVKPRNILLDLQGAPVVADFGLARVVDRESLTVSGGVSGTPHYMSPEQISDPTRIDARSDVFSLGIVMYELLSGATPFDGESSQVVLGRILREEPRSLRGRDLRIPRDLATICHKAIEKRPTDRYESACAMAADLRRYLSGRPIVARLPRWPTRVVKLVRRRPLVVATVSLATLIAAGTPTAYLWHQHVEHQRVGEAVHAVDQVFRVLSAAKLHRRPGQIGLYEAEIEQASDAYRTLLARDPDDQELLYRVARSGVRLGWIHVLAGRRALALRTYDNSIAKLRELATRHPTKSCLATLGRATHDRGSAMMGLGSYEGALVFFREALDAWARLPESARPGLDTATCHLNLGRALVHLHRLDEAEAEFDRAGGVWRTVSEEERGRPDGLRLQADIHTGRGWVQHARGEFIDGLAEFRAARDLMGPILAAEPDDWLHALTLAMASKGIGAAQFDAGRIDKAIPELEDAERRFAELAAQSPDATQHRLELAIVRRHLASCWLGAGKLSKAKELADRAAADFEAHGKRWPESTDWQLHLAQALNVAAWVRCETKSGRDDIMDLYLRALHLLGELPDVAPVLRYRGAVFSNIGALELREKRPDAARGWAAKAIEAQEQALSLAPKHTTSEAFLVSHCAVLIRASLGGSDHAAIMRAARRSTSVPGQNAVQYGFCAAAAALSIAMVRRDGSLPPDRRRGLEHRYGDDAVEWLRQAVELGHPKAEMIPRGVEFRVLQHRTDYRAVVADIRERARHR